MLETTSLRTKFVKQHFSKRVAENILRAWLDSGFHKATVNNAIPLELISLSNTIGTGSGSGSSDGKALGTDEDGLADPTPECRRILNDWLAKCVFKS